MGSCSNKEALFFNNRAPKKFKLSKIELPKKFKVPPFTIQGGTPRDSLPQTLPEGPSSPPCRGRASQETVSLSA